MPAININMYVEMQSRAKPLLSFNSLSDNVTYSEIPTTIETLQTNTHVSSPYYFVSDDDFNWDGNGTIYIPSDGVVTQWFQYNNNWSDWEDVTDDWIIVDDVNLVEYGKSYIVVGSQTIDDQTYTTYSFYQSSKRGVPTSGALEISFEIVNR